MFDINGWKVAVVGFGGVAPDDGWYATADTPGMRNGDDTPTMVEAVAAAEEVADLVVVTIHWGMELDTTPRQDDIDRAHAMIEAGADIIFGHHPHRMQPLEMVGDARGLLVAGELRLAPQLSAQCHYRRRQGSSGPGWDHRFLFDPRIHRDARASCPHRRGRMRCAGVGG